MGFLDSVSDKDFDLLNDPVYTAGERTEFVVNRVGEVVKPTETGAPAKTSVVLNVTTVTGPNEGRGHKLYIRANDTVIGKKTYLETLVGLFGKDAVVKKTAKLSDLVNTRIAAVPGKVTDRGYQNWYRYENLGKIDPTSSSGVPF